MAETCLSCDYHPAPVSTYVGPRPCTPCIMSGCFKYWKPVIQGTGYVSPTAKKEAADVDPRL